MKQISLYINIKYLRNSLIVLLFFSFFSCTSNKYVAQGDYLLKKNKIELDNKKINKQELQTYIKQNPNRKVLGFFKFHLMLYNMSNMGKTGWPHGWLRRIGEEPVIWDDFQTEKTTENFKNYLENKGYYYPIVTDSTLLLDNGKAKIIYTIESGEPYIIADITYFFEDTSIMNHVYLDTALSLIKLNMLFDKDIIQKERARIERSLKNRGYYRFTKEYVYFDANLIEGTNKIQLVVGFKEFSEGKPDPYTKVRKHKQYVIRDVSVIPDFRLGKSITADDSDYDTVFYNGFKFLYKDKLKIKPSVIANTSYIDPITMYLLMNVENSYKRFASMDLYKLVNISFKEPKGLQDTFFFNVIDATIELTRRKVQSYQFDIVGTHSYGYFGGRGNLSYQNRNLFRGAEVFTLNFTGAYEALPNASENDQFSNMVEFGTETSINFPKFIFPFIPISFAKKYYPQTKISAGFSYQDNPEFYTRRIANASFGYTWIGNRYLTHTIIPLELNYINVLYIDTSFAASIQGQKSAASFEDHLITSVRYGLEYNNQLLDVQKNYLFFKMNLETAGSGYYLLNELSSSNIIDSLIFGVKYYQYLKSDFDIRYFNRINSGSKLAYRLYIGIGNPFGQFRSLPFEKQFFAGGPNSMRAWVTRSLGPGSYYRASQIKIYNNTGDIKLEANIEYRFKLFWKLEGAFFLDAGNVWAMREAIANQYDPASLLDVAEYNQNAVFRWDKFYNDIAIGTGIGARFDFSFLLIRFDFGYKLKKPVEIPNQRDVQLQFGIGYPF